MKTIGLMSNAWATRPDDERFDTYTAMRATALDRKRASRDYALGDLRRLRFAPVGDDIRLRGPNGDARMTNWSFSQVASTLRLPMSLADVLSADAMSYALNDRLQRTTDKLPERVLLQQDSDGYLTRAFHGSRYAVDDDRLWDADVLNGFIENLPSGWYAPEVYSGGTWGSPKSPLAGFLGDRDMLVQAISGGDNFNFNFSDTDFHTGVIWGNSETGTHRFFAWGFLFNGVCGNNIFWNVKRELRIEARHTKGVRAAFQVACQSLRNGIFLDNDPLRRALEHSRENVIAPFALDPAEADKSIKKVAALTGLPQSLTLAAAQQAVVERTAWRTDLKGTAWDWLQGFTAVARTIPHADKRLQVESQASAALLVPVK